MAETKHESKLSQKMRTPRTNRANKKFQNTTYSFNTPQNTITEKFEQKQYNFYLDLEIPNTTQLLKVTLMITTDYKVSEALIKALQRFNTDLTPFGMELELDVKHYMPRLPKKSGKPKLDMPSLDLTQKIADVKVTTLSIQIKHPNAVKRLWQEARDIKQTKETKTPQSFTLIKKTPENDLRKASFKDQKKIQQQSKKSSYKQQRKIEQEFKFQLKKQEQLNTTNRSDRPIAIQQQHIETSFTEQPKPKQAVETFQIDQYNPKRKNCCFFSIC